MDGVHDIMATRPWYHGPPVQDIMDGVQHIMDGVHDIMDLLKVIYWYGVVLKNLAIIYINDPGRNRVNLLVGFYFPWSLFFQSTQHSSL